MLAKACLNVFLFDLNVFEDRLVGGYLINDFIDIIFKVLLLLIKQIIERKVSLQRLFLTSVSFKVLLLLRRQSEVGSVHRTITAAFGVKLHHWSIHDPFVLLPGGFTIDLVEQMAAYEIHRTDLGNIFVQALLFFEHSL